jgi:hypothetical protein
MRASRENERDQARIKSSGFGAEGPAVGVRGLGLRFGVRGSGFEVQDSGIGVRGAGETSLSLGSLSLLSALSFFFDSSDPLSFLSPSSPAQSRVARLVSRMKVQGCRGTVQGFDGCGLRVV